jgi:hypothetical protein
VADVDGHAGAGQVDFHLGNLPGGLNAEDLAVELAVVHETGLESGPAGSLSEPVNPTQNREEPFAIAFFIGSPAGKKAEPQSKRRSKCLKIT